VLGHACIDRAIPIAVFVIWGALVGPLRAEPPRAVPVDGEPFPAEIATIEGNWRIEFRSKDRERRLAADDLVGWGHFREAQQGSIVVMADGGLLRADILSADKQGLLVDVLSLGAARLPWKTLAGVVLRPPAGRRQTDLLLDRILKMSSPADRLLLTNDDELSGLFVAWDNQTIRLQGDAGPLDISVDAIRALVFDPALRQEPPEGRGVRAWIGLADGSRLLARKVVLQGDQLEIVAAIGPTWDTTAEKLVALQPLGNRVSYLSDLQPNGYRHIPYLNQAWPFRTDRNVSGGFLRAGGRLYLKGLGMHSLSRLTYPIDPNSRRFQAELAIDDWAAGGSVQFRVFVDGRPVYASGPIRGGDVPKAIDVDVVGAERLDLVVDFGERADQLDRADWLDARLVR